MLTFQSHTQTIILGVWDWTSIYRWMWKGTENFLKCVIYFNFCAWLLSCLECPSPPLPAANFYLTFMSQHRCHLFQKASQFSQVWVNWASSDVLMLVEAICHGPWTYLNIFAGYAKNVSSWLFFTHGVKVQGVFAASILEGWENISPLTRNRLNSPYSKNGKPLNLECISCNATHFRHPGQAFCIVPTGLLLRGEVGGESVFIC